ncbi:hypothetical protein M3210_11335 [Oceanobacillus luteolus]|uniref:hypothetical protein n=1 Tax=Oceanobacillus luteolus TaxID=1274358 RepID=UPI0036D27AD5|nr:hypothetical protein [Oceanobacillus luteolus]
MKEYRRNISLKDSEGKFPLFHFLRMREDKDAFLADYNLTSVKIMKERYISKNESSLHLSYKLMCCFIKGKVFEFTNNPRKDTRLRDEINLFLR